MKARIASPSGLTPRREPRARRLQPVRVEVDDAGTEGATAEHFEEPGEVKGVVAVGRDLERPTASSALNAATRVRRSLRRNAEVGAAWQCVMHGRFPCRGRTQPPRPCCRAREMPIVGRRCFGRRSRPVSIVRPPRGGHRRRAGGAGPTGLPRRGSGYVPRHSIHRRGRGSRGRHPRGSTGWAETLFSPPRRNRKRKTASHGSARIHTCASSWKPASTSATRPTAGTRAWGRTSTATATASTSST